MDIEPTGYNLHCTDGIARTIHGCSLEGLFEFPQRLRQLRQIMAKSDKPVAWLYAHRPEFRKLVLRCLALNGIRPGWINLAQMQQLLFFRFDDANPGQYLPGWLVEINQYPQRDGKPASLEELIAVLATHMDVPDALRLAKTAPAKQILKILEAKTRMQKTPEQRRDGDFRDWAGQQRKRRPINQPVTTRPVPQDAFDLTAPPVPLPAWMGGAHG